MANGKNDEYPDDWFFSPESSAVEALDRVGTDVAAIQSVDLIRGEGTVPPAYQKSFGFDEQMGRGMDYIADTAEDVSQDVIDKVSPALHIVGFETARKLIQRDWKWPKGWSPKVRTAGKHLVAYNLALKASEMVYSHVDDWNKNHPDMKLKPLPSQLAAGAGAYGSYKTASKFAWTVANSVKSGMAAEAVETVFKEAGEKATRQALKQFGTSQSARVAARLFGQEAAEKAATEAAGEVVKRMGKTAVDEFDEIKRVLKNPKVATRVGKYLARFAPKIAAKLAEMKAKYSGTDVDIDNLAQLLRSGALDIDEICKLVPNVNTDGINVEVKGIPTTFPDIDPVALVRKGKLPDSPVFDKDFVDLDVNVVSRKQADDFLDIELPSFNF